MLKSTDRAKFEEWTFTGVTRFLDGGICLDDEKVALCSFPRSGNSYLRRLIESCTGIATGSSNSLVTGTNL
jgi:hypothetical protein